MGSASDMGGQSPHAVARILTLKPAQRTAEDVEQLVLFLSEQPFFAGVPSSSLEVLSTCLGVQYAGAGDVVLHPGELTDRLYVLLSGICTVVRHSRREGFQPQPPQPLAPGQALCEASLVASGRRSDVAVTVSQAAAAPAAAVAVAKPPVAAADKAGDVSGAAAGRRSGSGDGSGGGLGGRATLIVLTRTAWNNMCARAPVKPEYSEARLALLCCCTRSLASSDPARRTLEQAEDLAALLRLLPGLAHTPGPVLRAMSESAYLRQLPPGTIMFEECTRAESEFLVLAGGVQTHSRPKRQGAANRAALRSALRSAVAAARGKSAKGAPKGGAEVAPKTVRQKIEEERRAREQIKQSLALQREGLRTPKTSSTKPTGARAVEEEFKKWMLEFLSRKRGGENTANNSATTVAGVSLSGAPGRSGLKRTVSIKAANAWKRAAAIALQSGSAGEDGGGRGHPSLEKQDTTLMEYERRKMEEAGGLRDVGNLLGGAAARKAYMRGLAAKDGGMYADDEPENNDSDASKPDKGGVHWGPQQEQALAAEEEPEVEDVDEEDADPWVRLTFLDSRNQVVRKAIRYIDAVEKVMGVAKQESSDMAKATSGATSAGGQAGAASSGGDPDGDLEEGRAGEEMQLLLLSGGDDAVAGASGGSMGAENASASGAVNAAPSGPGPDDIVDDACDEHFEQLYGPCGRQVEFGQVAGELPVAVLERYKKGGQLRTRRAHSAIAGPSGADVLVVVLEALRRGHEAARDDLVSERLAVLTALEPLRGLSDEHQAQLALGCTVVGLDGNKVVVRQAQLVDALFVVLEGEVRLLDDPDTTSTALLPLQPLQPPAGAAGGAAGTNSGASGAATTGGGAAIVPASDAPFRTATAAAGGGKLMSIKIRRAAASLAALTLLGPGGSFGESVLGYPEDVAAAAARESWEGDAAEASVPSSQYLATAMTSRPTKLLVLPRSLLVKYGYLRSSLPSFAKLRREAINGRRQQLQAGLQNRPTVAGATISNSSSSPGSGSSSAPVAAGRLNGSGMGIMRGGSDSFLSMIQLPSLQSSSTATATAAGGGAGASQAVAYQLPRPPPVRPSEILEKLGFKPVLRQLYHSGGKAAAACGNNGGNGASSNGSNNGGAYVAASSNSATSNNGTSGSGGAGGAPTHLPPPLPHAGNGFSAGGAALDRQHRRDLLAASALAAHNPQSLSNAIARARAEDPASLPFVVHAMSPAPPYRGSGDGSFTSASALKTSAVASAGAGAGAASLSSIALPTPFTSAAASRMRPLRLSVSGIGSYLKDNNSRSPPRCASLSDGVVGNGLPGGDGGQSAGGGVSIPALASPQPPLRGGGSTARAKPISTSAPNPHVSSVQLPRLAVAGGSSSGAATPTAGGNASGRALARPNLPGEHFLARLDASESSPRSYSPQTSASHKPGRSASSETFGHGSGGGGNPAAAALPVSVTRLGQRSTGQQPPARA